MECPALLQVPGFQQVRQFLARDIFQHGVGKGGPVQPPNTGGQALLDCDRLPEYRYPLEVFRTIDPDSCPPMVVQSPL